MGPSGAAATAASAPGSITPTTGRGLRFWIKVGKAAARAIDKLKPDYVVSECPMAGPHLKQVLKAVDSDVTPERIGHPIEVMVKAYGL